MCLPRVIHNNPKDIKGYENRVEKYPFSSLSEYINGTNKFDLLTRSFLVDLIGFKHKQNKKDYLKLVKNAIDLEMKNDVEFERVESEYRSEKVFVTRDYTPEEIITYVSRKLNTHPSDIHIKHCNQYTRMRALSCLLMSNFGNMGQREICEVIGNITQSGIGYLISRGLEIVRKERELIENFIDSE